VKCAGRYERMLCEKCQKKINKVLEVRWTDPLKYGYNWKQFESMDDLIEWVEKNDKPSVRLVIVRIKKNNEGKTYENNNRKRDSSKGRE
jgi:hypothetical protein